MSEIPKRHLLLRLLLGALYTAAGVLHLVNPGPFLAVTPNWVPWPETVILLTGLAELAGAAALVQPWSLPLRRAGGAGLALYALCVWPANINHMLMDLARASGGTGSAHLGYHIPRMALQPLLIWLALVAGGWTGKARHTALKRGGSPT